MYISYKNKEYKKIIEQFKRGYRAIYKFSGDGQIIEIDLNGFAAGYARFAKFCPQR